jgi:hypothetical protein
MLVAETGSLMATEDDAAARLREIAAAVGCPIEAFYSPAGLADDHEPLMTYELFRLWDGLVDQQARARVLGFIRQEAADRVAAAAE